MISIAEARAKVLESVRTNEWVRVSLPCAVGRVLAEAICYDLDSPPYDKALMDGYAVRVADVAGGRAVLEVIDQITAGSVPENTLRAGTAAEIMTGAPLPSGADAVVMVERTAREPGASRVAIDDPGIAAGQHVLRRGATARRGEPVFQQGHRLRPRDIGVLCEAGRAAARVVRAARVAVLATGDELVAPGVLPGPGQIRNSNGPMLTAMARQLGADTWHIGICRDDRQRLEAAVRRGLAHDVLVLSGGVSAGVRDLVPAVLKDAGVDRIFHKVHLKPGKPLWFGIRRAGGRSTYVFGLPGNPIGSLVCFQLFVRPVIRKMSGTRPLDCPTLSAILAHDYEQRWDRPTYYPVTLEASGKYPKATPLVWQGSADQRAVARADALAVFPAQRRRYPAGTAIDVLLMEDTDQ